MMASCDCLSSPRRPTHFSLLLACACVHDLQKGERELAQMQQCKSWWDEQSALAAQRRQQELQDKQDQAQTVR